MIYRLWYFIRETVVSLWRNLSLTLAAILTVGISLSLVGTSVLVREGADRATAQFQEGVEFIVFMNADHTPTRMRRSVRSSTPAPQSPNTRTSTSWPPTRSSRFSSLTSRS